jgi:hypothetical protein
LFLEAYTKGMKPTGFVLFFLVLLASISMPVLATEVYHWVDEDGVSHYSQSAPGADVAGVSKMTLEDTTPPDYDPEEDRYGVEAQAERMALLREEMAEKREAQREREHNAPQQPVVQYQQPYQYGNSPFWQPPYYPSPPLRPEQPIAPAPVFPFRPPGLNRN